MRDDCEYGVVGFHWLKRELTIHHDRIETDALKYAVGLGLRVRSGCWRALVHFFGYHLIIDEQPIVIFSVFDVTPCFMPGARHAPKRRPIFGTHRCLLPFTAEWVIRLPKCHERRRDHTARYEVVSKPL